MINATESKSYLSLEKSSVQKEMMLRRLRPNADTSNSSKTLTMVKIFKPEEAPLNEELSCISFDLDGSLAASIRLEPIE